MHTFSALALSMLTCNGHTAPPAKDALHPACIGTAPCAHLGHRQCDCSHQDGAVRQALRQVVAAPRVRGGCLLSCTGAHKGERHGTCTHGGERHGTGGRRGTCERHGTCERGMARVATGVRGMAHGKGAVACDTLGCGLQQWCRGRGKRVSKAAQLDVPVFYGVPWLASRLRLWACP